MIDKPLYQNPLSGGLRRRPNNPNDPIPSLNPDFTPSFELKAADPNNLLSGFRPPTSGGGFVTDMRDRTPQDPYEIGGGGALGVQKIDGSGGGALFLNDESRPRSEEDIRNRYEQAKAQAAEQRKTFFGQIVLPGEQSFDEFKKFSGNSFFLKRNPNIPESAYSNFDLTNIGGFDTPATDGGPTAPPGSATPMDPIGVGQNIFGNNPAEIAMPSTPNPIQGVGLDGAPMNPYNRVGQQLMGPNQDDILGTLKNIEQGIASLVGNYGQDFNSNKSSNYGDFDNFGIGSFFPPYGGMYG